MRRRTPLALAALLPLLAFASDQTCPLGGSASERFRRVAGRGFAFASGGVREVTAESGYCSGCHDATIASPVEVALGTRAGEVGSLAGSHPVDVAYPSNDPGYRPAFELDKRLVLENGNVTCRTCHGGTDPATRYLSVEPATLCLECHRK